MTKDELITKQQLQLEEYKIAMEENMELNKKLVMKFIAIGQPLNDNVLQFNKEQLKWCFGVMELIEQMNCAVEG